MSLSPELMYAILAMDAYNRGYNAGVLLEGDQVGLATIKSDAETRPETAATAKSADFYAVEYEWFGDTIIAYRGTDHLGRELPDVDLPLAINADYDEAQVHLASRFYQAVAGSASPYSMVLTGHSLGGALAGFTGSLYNQHIVAVDTIGFWPAFQEFKALIDQYLLVKNTPQEFTDEIDVPGVLGKVNTVQFAESQLLAMGIPFNDIPPLDDLLDHYTAFHAKGEVAGTVRFGTPSTPMLDQLPDMSFVVGIEGAHSISFAVILKYIEDMAVPLDFQPLLIPLFSALFDGQLAERAGAVESGISDKDTVMRDAIAYSAIDGDVGLVFGNTGIRALFDDANELGKLVDEGKIPMAFGDPVPALAEAIVQFAGQMALNEVNYNDHQDWTPEQGFLRLNEEETVLTAHLAKELWNLGGADVNREVEIKGIQTILDSFVVEEEEAEDILSALTMSFGRNIIDDHRVINRIDFDLGTGTATIKLDENEEQTAAAVPYIATATSLFLARDGSDTVDGTRDNNVIVGGDGDDILYGRLGKDILLGGRGRDRFIDLVTEVAPDGRTNEDDIYYGEPSDESLLGLFFGWLSGSQVEDTVEYRLADERDAEAELPGQGLEIASLSLSTVGEAEAIELAITDLNSGKTGTDYLVDIDKVVLSERRDEVIVNPAWLDVPLWIDLGKAIENRMAA